MSDYLWSARFITGALTLLLGVTLLIGGVRYLPWSVLLWAAVLFALRHRIAPTPDPPRGSWRRLCRAWSSPARAIRGLSS